MLLVTSCHSLLVPESQTAKDSMTVSYLLSHFSYLVNISGFFLNQRDYVFLKNTSLVFAST